MNKKLLAAAIAGSAAIAFAATPDSDDPVLMTIDGTDIRLSEFEYLFNKNNSQQAEPVTFDQYVGMFIDYKLKVADAYSEGVDTTDAFRREFNKFRNELAMPHLRDQATYRRLSQEAYDHLAQEVFVSHIMFNLQSPDAQAVADSVRNLIASGQMSYEDAARQFSIDRQSAENGGRMGWISTSSKLPYPFEAAAYDTPVGEISQVVNSGAGLHIIRPEERRPSKGEVKASHILVLTRGLDDAACEAAHAKIDSLYAVVTAPGADFADVATRESQDPGSARRGGDLGWFGSGRMVAEFDSVSFALADGEISKPFKTSYGYHIVLRTGHRGGYPLQPIEQLQSQIDQMIEGDMRAEMPIIAYLDTMAARNNASVNTQLPQQLTEFLDGTIVCDTAVFERIKAFDVPAYSINGKSVNLPAVLDKRSIRIGLNAPSTVAAVLRAVDNDYQDALLSIGRDELYENNADYRFLVNEYRDGILLFDVANSKVWERASNDTEGLEQYFQAHRSDYAWDEPRYKAFVVFASNDSVLSEVQAFVAGNFMPGVTAPQNFTSELRNKFGRDIRIERVIARKGENPITDYLGFGAGKPETESQRWPVYFALDGQVITEPQEVSDVKGQVVQDYQRSLEEQWLQLLHQTHTVTVYDDVLNYARQRANQQ